MANEWFCNLSCGRREDCKHRNGGNCVYEYYAPAMPPEFRWKGDGPPPSRWWANGTLVYRTFSDSCD